MKSKFTNYRVNIFLNIVTIYGFRSAAQLEHGYVFFTSFYLLIKKIECNFIHAG